jgi:predicted membrane protein
MNGRVHRDSRCERQWKRYEHSPLGKALGGIILVTVGATLMARQLGVIFPEWLFSWPVLLIVIGVYIGARHLFRNPGWIIMVTVGAVFLLDTIYTEINITTFFWPLFIMAAGLFMIFKPKRKPYQVDEEMNISMDSENVNEDAIDTVSVFGGVKKNILSKNFRGGEITCIMGGAEINLSQADIQGRVVLEVTQVLGGTKLIIPPNWDVQPEMVAVLGGIEDKRQVQTSESAEKILVIRGTSVLGGIEIKSY